MIIVLAVLLGTSLLALAAQMIAHRRAKRADRDMRMLDEAWAIHRASRQIHDATAQALQAMLDEARARRSEHR